MEKVYVNAGDGYDVLIGTGLLAGAGIRVREALGIGGSPADREPPAAQENRDGLENAGNPEPAANGVKLALFTDTTVGPLYGETVEKSLREAGFTVVRYEYPAGEKSKNIETVAHFVEFMAESGMTRKDAVVVLGGGVAGDMGGFAAATYMRGIKFIQIPTSLLAAVDSSVGGKTGVDITAGKNLMGAFWQPSLVLCDTDVFESLTEDLLLDGFAEVIKTAAIRDGGFFERLEYAVGSGGGPGVLRSILREHAADIVRDCVRIKGNVVENDEREGGLRRILNFGHTMAHAIEKDADYSISHGKAVAIGMLMVTAASEKQGLTPAGVRDRLFRMISGLGYATEYDAPLEALCEIARKDKKNRGNYIGIVLLEEIGRAAVTDVKTSGLAEFYRV